MDAIFADLTKPGSPGCAIGIYRDGKIVYAKGYGLANLEENVPLEINSAQQDFDSPTSGAMPGGLRLFQMVWGGVGEFPTETTPNESLAVASLTPVFPGAVGMFPTIRTMLISG